MQKVRREPCNAHSSVLLDPWDGKKVSEDSPSWNLLLSHAYDDLVRANKVQTGPLVILHNILTITYLQRGAGVRDERVVWIMDF